MRRVRGSEGLLCGLIFAAGAVMCPAQAGTPQGKQSERLIDYVSPALVGTDASPDAASQAKLFPPNPTNLKVLTLPSVSTEADRWTKFEADFGIKTKDPSFVKSSIESAKYKLDETVFAAKEFADTLHYDAYLTDLLTGTSSNSPPRRYYSDPILDSLENTRIRTGLDWDRQSGRAFVGLRLVVPFGD